MIFSKHIIARAIIQPYLLLSLLSSSPHFSVSLSRSRRYKLKYVFICGWLFLLLFSLCFVLFMRHLSSVLSEIKA